MKRTVGTQTPVEFLMAAIVQAKRDAVEVEVEEPQPCQPMECSSDTTTTKAKPTAAAAKPTVSTSQKAAVVLAPSVLTTSPCTKGNLTTKTDTGAKRRVPIFSPKSHAAANTLTSLFSQGARRFSEDRVSPLQEDDDDSTEVEDLDDDDEVTIVMVTGGTDNNSTANAGATVTMTDAEPLSAESSPATKTATATTTTATTNTTPNTEQKAQPTASKTTEAQTPATKSVPTIPTAAHINASVPTTAATTTTTATRAPATTAAVQPTTAAPPSQVKQPYPAPQQQTHYPPHHHPHHHSASPQTVYYSSYYPEGHPPPPHPSHGWTRHPAGPWTPVIGGKAHPGRTPHHRVAHHPSGWMPTVMEQPNVMYHNPYGPSPPAKDGSDPNSAVRLASTNNSLVTPTPKKPKFNNDPRQHPPPPPNHQLVHVPPGHQVVVQRAAIPHHQLPMYAAQHAAARPPQPVAPSASLPPPHPQTTTKSNKSAATMGDQSQDNNQAPAPQVAQSAPVAQQQQQPPQPQGYSRKKKSLGVLAENFLETFENCPAGTEIIVDEAANRLGVERRRIYDVVNILEAVQLVVKKGKNTYTWLGKEFLPDIFGKLQAQAILEYPDDAVRFGLKTPVAADAAAPPAAGGAAGGAAVAAAPAGGRHSRRGSMSSTQSEDSRGGFRSLAKLSQQFLQIFLVGYDIVSLPQASEMIQGTLSAEAYAAIGTAHANIASRFDPTAPPPPQLENPAEFRRAAQRGLKTKIRRLYDIANVFLSVGLLRKVEHNSTTSADLFSNNRRPNFQWAYHMSPKQILEVFTARKRESPMGIGGLGHPNLLRMAQTTSRFAPVPPPSFVPVQVDLVQQSNQDERTPSRAEGKILTDTPVSDSTVETDPPLSVTTSNSSETENVETATPSNTSDATVEVPSKTMDGKATSGTDAAGGNVLANIHQSGGAYQPSPAPIMARTVTQADDA
ncbi:E2F transcription factor-like [Seminavis robusta]|uniref:E2F transcription factor-like n=1 Tax=Seminavis robusta TaxID=568900 RepID=A0A9N8HSZ6_9STRA|nr:E2F transcription factor-like [Seminavis robusta]|eukprot:Sro1798_g298290.1 E2F transcription factor-like (953) ;mRNA; r:17491-20448